MKKTFIGIIIGGIVFIGVGVVAATYLYNANQISYSGNVDYVGTE